MWDWANDDLQIQGDGKHWATDVDKENGQSTPHCCHYER